MSDQRILDRLGQMREALSAIERLTALWDTTYSLQ